LHTQDLRPNFLAGAMKRVKQALGGLRRSSRQSSQRTSSSSALNFDDFEGSPMQEDAAPVGVQQAQASPTIDAADAPHLDIRGDREMQAYLLLKDRAFLHTPAIDPDLLEMTGMDVELPILFRAVGWQNVPPLDEEGSRLLTIQFLCTLVEDKLGISFRLFNTSYHVKWADLANYWGFYSKCAIELDASIPGFVRSQFWGEISGALETGTFKPRHSQIQHPSLRFIHRWMSLTLFPRHGVRWVNEPELKLLYAIIHKIKIAPVKEMCKNLFRTIAKPGVPIDCTSLITRLAAAVGALDKGVVEYITEPRDYWTAVQLAQGHLLRALPSGGAEHTFPGYTTVIRLPNPGLQLYKSQQLTFELETADNVRRQEIPSSHTRSSRRTEAGSSSRAQHFTPPAFPMQTPQADWPHPMGTPGVIPGYDPRWMPQPQTPAPSEWPEGSTNAWGTPRFDLDSSSEDMPPPVRTQTFSTWDGGTQCPAAEPGCTHREH